jgi:uncharacterized membrane protein SpoIIM required for sporulation
VWFGSQISCWGGANENKNDRALHVKQENFESQYRLRWDQFEQGVALTAKQRATRKTDSSKNARPIDASLAWPLEELPRRYREICHHLALARDRHYSSTLVERLERLVLVGHQALYGAQELSGGVGRFLRAGLPRLVRQHSPYMWASALLFFAPLIACLIAIQYFPEFAYVIVSPEQMAEVQQMYAPENRRLGLQRDASTDFAMFGFYVANNVRIDFQCFAGGLLFGVGAIFFLLFNGLHIGAIAGHLTHVGYIETFWGFVAGHSAFELTGIVLSGAAGLMLGMALIAPGRQTRFAAVKSRMPDIIGVVYGAALLTFLAAFIEAFWSASRVPPVEVKYAVGIGLWVLTLAYFIFVGRGAGSEVTEAFESDIKADSAA